MSSDSYVLLFRRRFFGSLVRGKPIKRFANVQSAVDYLRDSEELLSGNYSAVVYWDGEWDVYSLNKDKAGNISIDGLNTDSVRLVRAHSKSRAFADNEFFSPEEREFHRKQVAEIEKMERPKLRSLKTRRKAIERVRKKRKAKEKITLSVRGIRRR